MGKLAFALLLLLSSSSASAHSWYPEGCCKDVHCHPTPCDTIKQDGHGYVWFDAESRHNIFFTREQMKASQDDSCHVCVLSWTGVCIFLPWQS